MTISSSETLCNTKVQQLYRMIFHSAIAGNLRDELSAGRIASAVVAYWILSFAFSYLTGPRIPDSLPRVGKDKNPIQKFLQWPALIQDGYEKYSKKGMAFVMPGALGRTTEVIIPRKQMSWMLDLPDDKLSVAAAHRDQLRTDMNLLFAGCDPYHENIIHRSLPRALNDIIPALQDQVQHSMDEIFGVGEEWRSLKLWDTLFTLVAPLTNRMLVGQPLCNNKHYLSNATAYAHDVIRNMILMNLVPTIFAPIASRILGLANRYHYWQTAKHTIPLAKQRLADMADPDFKAPNDYLTWHIRIATADGRVDELNPKRMSERLLPLNFAAIHTTTLTGFNCLLNVLASDEKYDTLALLREEVERVFTEAGGVWTKAALGKLYRMDSALRESMRHSCFAVTQMQRKVVAKEGIYNEQLGFKLEYGTLLTCPELSTSRDAETYGENVGEFDPWRFSREREEYEKKGADEKREDEALRMAQKGMVTTGETHFPFGHGRHACPGRFFAAHELKMVFVYLLLNYDVKPYKERPVTKWMAGATVPPVGALLELRRKTVGKS